MPPPMTCTSLWINNKVRARVPRVTMPMHKIGKIFVFAGANLNREKGKKEREKEREKEKEKKRKKRGKAAIFYVAASIASFL